VAVGVKVAVGDGVADGAHEAGEAVGDGVGLGVGVGDGIPTAAEISTRPQPYVLFGGLGPPHVVSEIKCAALSNASRLGWIWWRRLGNAHHSKAIAPAMCGVAMDVPLKFV
jgi:hypothetical protein